MLTGKGCLLQGFPQEDRYMELVNIDDEFGGMDGSMDRLHWKETPSREGRRIWKHKDNAKWNTTPWWIFSILHRLLGTGQDRIKRTGQRRGGGRITD